MNCAWQVLRDDLKNSPSIEILVFASHYMSSLLALLYRSGPKYQGPASKPGQTSQSVLLRRNILYRARRQETNVQPSTHIGPHLCQHGVFLPNNHLGGW